MVFERVEWCRHKKLSEHLNLKDNYSELTATSSLTLY